MRVRAHRREHLELLHDPNILERAGGISGASVTDQRRRAIILRSGGVVLFGAALCYARFLRKKIITSNTAGIAISAPVRISSRANPP